MIILNREDAETLVQQAEQNFKLLVRLDPISKLQLLLTFKISKGVELFGVGPTEIRYGHMMIYGDLINNAVNNNYRVFIRKDGTIFTKSDWFLEFVKG